MNEEFDKLLNDIKQDQPQSLDEVLGIKEEVSPEKVEAEEIPEKDDEPRKNRKHRRWENQLTEREKELIAREARIQAMEEMGAKRISEQVGDVDPRLLQLYGTEERGKEAAALHQQIIQDAVERARQDALQEFEARKAQEEDEVNKFSSFIDESFENLEDAYDTDFTSNAPAARKARNEILDLLEKMSPKDATGNIREYADINGVYEIWKERKTSEKDPTTSNRQKELASRTMVSGQGGDNQPKPKNPSSFSNWRQWAGIE